MVGGTGGVDPVWGEVAGAAGRQRQPVAADYEDALLGLVRGSSVVLLPRS